MEATLARVQEMQPQPMQGSRPRTTRKSHRQEEGIRYFLAKDGSSIEKPELGVEVASEGDALIKAFQSKNGVIYTLESDKFSGQISFDFA